MNDVRHYPRAFPRPLLLLLLLLPRLLFAQTFSVSPSQLNIALVAGINHLPVSVPITYNPANINPANLSVSSDSAWVTPSVNPTTGALALTFSTAGLTNNSYTATLTLSNGNASQQFFVQATVSPMNIVALRDDPTRSRTYGIQQNALNAGAVVVFDPINAIYLGSITVGDKPDDLAVSADGTELLVICSVSQSITVINLQTLAVTGTIPLPNYTDWGQSSTSAHVAYGPGNIIYYTDGAWAPVLHVFDRSSNTVLQTDNIDPSSGYGFGDLVVSGDDTMLFGWAQYGWTAGWAGSYISKFTINSDGTLTFVNETNSNYPTTLARDPLNTPALISADNHLVIIKQLGVSSASVNDTLQAFPGPIYAISPEAEIASTQSAIYQTSTGALLADLPVNTTVQAITSDYARLVYFDPTADSLKTVNLPQTVGLTALGQVISPANQALTLAPTTLHWTAIAGVKEYQVYFGTSQVAVVQATTASPEYQGQVVGISFTLGPPLAAGTTYYWRADPVLANGVGTGTVESFTVTDIASNVSSVDVATVQGNANNPVSIDLTSASAGESWTASASAPWVTFTANTGVTPATLQVMVDASQLSPGLNEANITITGNLGSFTIPVNLQVEPLALTVIHSDPASNMVYAISEAPTSGTTQAYLLEIDSQQQKITRVVRVGTGATDLAIHHGDHRIYVTNWLIGSLIAVDLDTFAVDQIYNVPSFAGVGYSQADCYSLAAGGQGRLIYEGEDQWIDLSLFNTDSGNVITKSFQREGGGAFDPTGRYYYHGDYNISDAAMHKFDTAGDVFTALGQTDTGISGYYGDRTVVVSEDGSRVFWDGAVYDQNLNYVWSPNDTIYSATPDGRFAFGPYNIYDTVQQQVAFNLPANTSVSAYNSSSGAIVLQVGATLAFYPFYGGNYMPAPTMAAGAVGHSSANLTWTDESLETGFTLQERVTGTTAWLNVPSTIPANTIAQNVTNLTPETSYDFRINANSPEVSSAWSNIITLTTLAPPPPPPLPSLNSVVVDGPTSTTLNWSISGTDSGIVVERSTDGVNWTVVANLTTGTTQYTDTGLSPSTAYKYRLYTTLNGQNSAFSNIYSATTSTPIAPPTPPAFIIAAADTDTSVGIFWEGGAGATNYILERSSNDSAFVPVANVSAATPYFTDTTLTPDTFYAYQIVAVNAGGNSTLSTTAWAQTYTEMDSWLLTNYGTTAETPQTDPLTADTDGVQNLAKFAFNLPVGQPATTEVVGAGTAGLPAIWLDPASNRLCVEFVCRNSVLTPGITYVVEFSNDLINWAPGGTLIQTQTIDSIWNRVRYEDDVTLPTPTSPSRFARVQIIENN